MDDIATAPFDAARAATDTGSDHDGSAGADDSSLDALVERLSRRFDRVMWDRSGHVLAALAAVSDPVIRHALAAADVVADLDREHQPVRWAPDSPTVVCRAGCGAHPCHTRERLDRLDGGLT